MSAEVLREAAWLMRERAEAATEGPWRTYSDPGSDSVVVFDQYGLGVQSATTLDVVAYDGQIYGRDAEHIASWHPAVALAVADWLDMASVGACCDECMEDLAADPFRHQALAVARAYLGTDQP